jgi:hypothetical protein
MTYQCHRPCHAAVFSARRVEDGRRVWIDANRVPTSKNTALVVVVNAGDADEDAIVVDLPDGAGLRTAFREHRCRRRPMRRRTRLVGHLRSAK